VGARGARRDAAGGPRVLSPPGERAALVVDLRVAVDERHALRPGGTTPAPRQRDGVDRRGGNAARGGGPPRHRSRLIPRGTTNPMGPLDGDARILSRGSAHLRLLVAVRIAG